MHIANHSSLWLSLCAALALVGGTNATARSQLATPSFVDEDPISLDILTLTSVRYRRGRPLPESVMQFNGKNITLEAYMSIDTVEGVDKFLVTFDSCGCSASNPHHYVEITLTEGLVSYVPGRVQLTGILEVGEVEDDLGFVTSVYRMKTNGYTEL